MYEIRPIGRPVKPAQNEEGPDEKTIEVDSGRLCAAGGLHLAPERRCGHSGQGPAEQLGERQVGREGIPQHQQAARGG